MNTTPQPESAPSGLSSQSAYAKQSSPNPYSRMSSRRAIACTICAKAKTKCDKAVPSCSRCTAKGLTCEPRSTRRTSDSNYRNNKTRHMVSPKRFSSTNSVPSLSRHSSPRSVPLERHQMMRSVSQMDMQTAAKMAGQRTDFSGYPMLTPLPTYSPQIIDECYSYSSSPESNMSGFSLPYNAGRFTPQTPDSFLFNDSMSSTDSYDQYMNNQAWSDDGNGIPIGLGFESDIPGMIPIDNMWGTPEPEGFSTPMGQMAGFDSPRFGSPASMSGWSHQEELSVSPPLIPHNMPHTRAVPSLSISDCSSQDFGSPKIDDWQNFRPNTKNMIVTKTNPSNTYIDGVKSIPKNQALWEDVKFPRLSPAATF